MAMKEIKRVAMDRKIVGLLQQERGLKSIAKSLGCGKTKVRKIKDLAREHGYLGVNPKTLPPFPEALFAAPTDLRTVKSSDSDLALKEHLSWVTERLTAGWQPITVFEELPQEIKEVTSRSSFYRFLNRHDLHKLSDNMKRKLGGLVAPIVHKPGEALILDWGKLIGVWDEKTGKRKTLWAFVGVMGYSRYTMVRLVWSNDVDTTTAAIQSMLSELGGVPARLTSDNPKCFALEASNYDPLLNPAMERLAAHYGFILECLPPRDPQKKGKVERMMPFIRRLYQAHTDAWNGTEESQEYMNKKLIIANDRKHGTTMRQPAEVFISEEAPALKSLPALAFEPAQFFQCTVRRDAFARVDSRYYALPDSLISKEIQALATKTQVSFYYQGKLIEVYSRLTSFKIHVIKEHLLKPHHKLMEDHGHYIKRAAAIGPATQNLVSKIITQGNGFVDTRKVWGILSLDKNYTKEDIDFACALSLEMNTLSSRSVTNILRNSAKKKIKMPTPTNEKSNFHATTTATFARPISEYSDQVPLFH